jgi:hypothetical protein
VTILCDYLLLGPLDFCIVFLTGTIAPNLAILQFQIRLYKPYIVQKLVKKVFDQCKNKYGVPFEKNVFLIFLVRYV